MSEEKEKPNILADEFTFTVDIKVCQRCEKSHKGLMAWPIQDVNMRFNVAGSLGYTHYATCPETSKPTMIKVTSYEPDKLVRGGGGRRDEAPE